MTFTPKFFYNDGASEGGAGSETTPPVVVETPIVDQTPTPTTPTPEIPEDVKAQLKELEELRAYKASKEQPAKSKEEIEREEEIEKVNFRKYAVENKLLKDEEFDAYSSLKSKQDQELVFSDFAKQYTEDHPEADPQFLQEEIEAAFEDIYHLKSEDKTLKARGSKLLQKEAAEIRTPLETSYSAAQGQWKEDKQMREAYPKYAEFIDKEIARLTPPKMTFTTKDGETEVPVEIELTEAERLEIAAKFKNEKTFYRYTKGETEQLSKDLERKISGYIKEAKFDQILAKTAEIHKGLGVKQGSTVGAENLFAAQQNNQQPAKIHSLEESNEIMRQKRERFAR